MAAGEAYSLYVEPAAEGANEADGPLSSLYTWPSSPAGRRTSTAIITTKTMP
jgi:hypothetical protein